MSESKAFEVRITQLEETVLHQERLVQQLNEIVIQLRAGLEKMEAENEERRRQVKWLTENNSIIEDRADKKPPHY
jgi:uncharacterized coiled-coil protein SlyX